MKKIMIAVAAVAMAFASQAATFNWKSSVNAMGVDLDAVVGNGTFAVGSQTMKQQGSTSWAVTIAFYDGGDLVASVSPAIKYSASGSKFTLTGLEVADLADGKAYDYIITITGAPAGLTGKESEDWDYKAATMSTKITGSVTTAAMGNTSLNTGVPANWEITGAIAKEKPDPTPVVPEPTSGLLLVLGMAGLALKRKLA